MTEEMKPGESAEWFMQTSNEDILKAIKASSEPPIWWRHNAHVAIDHAFDLFWEHKNACPQCLESGRTELPSDLCPEGRARFSVGSRLHLATNDAHTSEGWKLEDFISPEDVLPPEHIDAFREEWDKAISSSKRHPWSRVTVADPPEEDK